MKTEDCSKLNKINHDNCRPENTEKLMGRREILSKAGWYALSTATMMVLMKSQPAKAQSPQINMPAPNIAPNTEVWRRTTRK